MMMSIEWHMLAGFIGLLSLALPPLFWVFLLMLATPIALSIIAAAQAPTPKHKHWLTRPLIAYLHWRQPIKPLEDAPERAQVHHDAKEPVGLLRS